MRKIDQYVIDNQEELSKLDNVLVNGTVLKEVDGARYERRVTVQLFLTPEGNVRLARLV